MSYDIETMKPLQIKTDSKVGSGDKMWVNFIGNENHYGLSVTFNDTPSYEVYHCSLWKEFTMPNGNEHIWTITRTKSNLTLYCDSVEIFHLEFSVTNKCEKLLGQPITDFRFNKEDTASDSYRHIPKRGAKFKFYLHLVGN